MRKISTAILTFALFTSTALAADPLPALRVSDNGRYFVKADGTPFFWQGDTAWTIFNHPTPAEVDLYLDDRKAKGFNVIQGCVAVWSHNSRRNPDGQTPFVDNNPANINEAFYKNVDSILDKAAARRMYVAILPFWTKNTRTGPYADPEAMKNYTTFLAKRYATRNLIWVLGGDTAGTDVQAVTDAEAAGLLEGAKQAGVNDLFITFHPTGRQSSSFWFHERPWLDFNAIQSGHFINTTNFRLVGDDWNKTPVRPTLDTEPGYENITDNLVRTNVTPETRRIQAVDIRRSAYLSVFAGAAGHTYGNGEVYEFWSPPSQGGRGNMPGWSAQMPWKEALQLPGAGQMQHLRRLIESRPMLGRIPDQSLLAGAPVNRAVERIAAARADDGSYAFIYFPAGQKTATVQTAKLSGNTLNATWYNPRSGVSSAAESFAKTESRAFTIPQSADDARPEDTDWVLILDAKQNP